MASSFGHKLGSKFRRFSASKNYNTMNIQCVERLFLGVADDGSLLKNEVYTVCSALVPSRGLCRIFAYRTRCVARSFLHVAYVGSLIIERGIHSV